MANNSSSSYTRVLEKVTQAIKRRGEFGIRDLGRTFRIYDDSRNGFLSKDEFRKGLADYKVLLTAGVPNLSLQVFSHH
jgi:hypothetical protein